MNALIAKLYKALPLSKNAQLAVVGAKEDKFLVGVTGIIFNDEGKVLLFKHTYREIPWSLPGGYIKAGEHPKEGLEREIKEESGLIVSADERIKIRTDREAARLDVGYVGKFMGGEFKPSGEVAEMGWFGFDELPIIMKGQLVAIKDAVERKGKNGQISENERVSWTGKIKRFLRISEEWLS